MHMDRQNFLLYKPKSIANNAVLPFVMTYHSDLPNVRDIVDIRGSFKKFQDWADI